MSEEGGDTSEQGVGNDDDLIDPNKAKHKIIRVLTVIAYALSVSMAAILLSIYYVFMWDGHPTLARKDPMAQQQPPPPAAYAMSTSGTTMPTHATTESEELIIRSQIFDRLAEPDEIDETTEDNVQFDLPFEPTAIPVVEAKTEAPSPSTADPIIEENLNDGDWPINITYPQLPELTKRSPMFKKLILRGIMD